MPPSVAFVRVLAIIGGVALPLAELLRRRSQLSDITLAPFWLDDVLLGAFLLYGAWRTRPTHHDAAAGQSALAAAWAACCGLGYAGFFSQLATLSKPDPSGVAPTIVVAIRGALLAIALVSLIVTLRWKPLSAAFSPDAGRTRTGEARR